MFYNNIIVNQVRIKFHSMVGRVGYAPTTPAMSMQYSTIELTAQKLKSINKLFKNISVSFFAGCPGAKF